jgi:predicted nucleotidyltransferase
MTVKTDLRALARDKRGEILEACARYGASNVRLFGSVARGDFTEESDVDFLIDLEKGRSLLDLGGLYMDLRDLMGRRVDVVTSSSLRSPMRERVLAEVVAL